MLTNVSGVDIHPATTSSEVDKNQQTSSDAGTLQEESGPTDEEKANDESKCSLFLSRSTQLN